MVLCCLSNGEKVWLFLIYESAMEGSEKKWRFFLLEWLFLSLLNSKWIQSSERVDIYEFMLACFFCSGGTNEILFIRVRISVDFGVWYSDRSFESIGNDFVINFICYSYVSAALSFKTPVCFLRFTHFSTVFHIKVCTALPFAVFTKINGNKEKIIHTEYHNADCRTKKNGQVAREHKTQQYGANVNAPSERMNECACALKNRLLNGPTWCENLPKWGPHRSTHIHSIKYGPSAHHQRKYAKTIQTYEHNYLNMHKYFARMLHDTAVIRYRARADGHALHKPKNIVSQMEHNQAKTCTPVLSKLI